MGIDTGSTSFMILCMALVQLMTPGLAFFYGGLVRSTNVVGIMMQSFVSLGLVFVLWWAVLFSMSFGESIGGFVGSPSTYMFWDDVSAAEPFPGVDGIPGLVFAGYQGMFAVITPALMTGAFADRMKFFPYLLFVTIWMFVVYAPVCHWVWGGGWMQAVGAHDFAGGIVVHATSGFGALASVVALGKRSLAKDDHAATAPHNVPFVALGTALLWFGWFGFNGGSALAADKLAAQASLNTQLAGSVALCGWLALEVMCGKKPGLVGACVGAVAGLATITPAAGFVTISGAFFIGCCASIVCFFCVFLTGALGLDDALDVWGVHGMGGVCGTILLGALADPKINPDATGSLQLVGIQTGCVLLVSAYSFVLTYGILFILNVSIGIRVSPKEEATLDFVLHQEEAYVMSGKPLVDSLSTESGSSDSDDVEDDVEHGL